MLHTKSNRVEGLTLQALRTYLLPSILPEPKLRHILAMFSIGGGIEYFKLEVLQREEPREATCQYLLVCGSDRTLILGYRTSEGTFQETQERRTFFVKPGNAPITTLRVTCEIGATSPALLMRDERYQYWLDGRRVHLFSATSTQVRLEIVHPGAEESLLISLAASTFWSFVFGTYDRNLRDTEVSAEHVAALLGLNREKTLARHIGAGHLPAKRAGTHHPGITLTGLEEFLAYRQQFPQGCPNIRRVEAWQQEWKHAHQVDE